MSIGVLWSHQTGNRHTYVFAVHLQDAGKHNGGLMAWNRWPAILSHKHTSDLKTISEELHSSRLCFKAKKTGVMILVVQITNSLCSIPA